MYGANSLIWVFGVQALYFFFPEVGERGRIVYNVLQYFLFCFDDIFGRLESSIKEAPEYTPIQGEPISMGGVEVSATCHCILLEGLGFKVTPEPVGLSLLVPLLISKPSG